MIYSLEDFDFQLPHDQIAAEALEERSASRMLLVDRADRTFRDERFSQLGQFVTRGDVLVLNNTKVFPARLFGETETGASMEIFLVEELEPGVWTVLAKPGKRLAEGRSVRFSDQLWAEVIDRRSDGGFAVKFQYDGDLAAEFDRLGRTPPPTSAGCGRRGLSG